MTDKIDRDEEDREPARQESDVVFRLSSDSDAVGGACWAEVRGHSGRYWAFADFDLAADGPFAGLEQDLRDSGRCN